jgi:hypothetical protein
MNKANTLFFPGLGRLRPSADGVVVTAEAVHQQPV